MDLSHGSIMTAFVAGPWFITVHSTQVKRYSPFSKPQRMVDTGMHRCRVIDVKMVGDHGVYKLNMTRMTQAMYVTHTPNGFAWPHSLFRANEGANAVSEV
jgi:hypothetical protein